MQSAFDNGSVTYFGPGGVPAAILEVESLLDFAGERFRGTFAVGADIVLIQQLTGDTGFSYTPQTGTLPLPPSERNALREVFVTGIAGVLRGDDRDAAEILPDVTLEGIEATAIALVTDGVEHLVFIAEDCSFVAEVTLNPQVGELLTFYSDFRDVDGYLLPFFGEAFVGDEIFARVESVAQTVNLVFRNDQFEAP